MRAVSFLTQKPTEKEASYGKNKDDVKKLSYEKEKSATTYAVTKEIKQVVYAPGSVTRMSVAVAVNKILTDSEKEEIKNLVIAAAGMDIARGDVVSARNSLINGSTPKFVSAEPKKTGVSLPVFIISVSKSYAAPSSSSTSSESVE